MSKCGCSVEVNGAWTQCPLHAAAPALYEELARIYTEEAGGLKTETVDRILKLLAEVQR